MIQFIKKRPWIWIILAFVILITGWVFLLRISIEYRPKSIEFDAPAESQHP